MDAAKLIRKLLELERETDFQASPEAHSRLLEAQNIAVELYHDRMAILSENVRLRDALQATAAPMLQGPEHSLRLATKEH